MLKIQQELLLIVQHLPLEEYHNLRYAFKCNLPIKPTLSFEAFCEAIDKGTDERYIKLNSEFRLDIEACRYLARKSLYFNLNKFLDLGMDVAATLAIMNNLRIKDLKSEGNQFRRKTVTKRILQQILFIFRIQNCQETAPKIYRRWNGEMLLSCYNSPFIFGL
jgi:hypothetical protein